MENSLTKGDQLIVNIGRQTAKLRNSVQAGLDALRKKDSYKHSFALREMAENRRNPVSHLMSGYASIAFAVLAMNLAINSLK